MSREIRFYFDYISHNAWIAWTQIHSLAERYDCTVIPVPVLFAGLLKAHGQLGPAEVPPKVRWMLNNTLRKAALLDIPLKPPASYLPIPLGAATLWEQLEKAETNQERQQIMAEHRAEMQARAKEQGVDLEEPEESE